jgi:hypothetical protein
MDRQTLERRLTVALSNLIVDDWRLLTTWAPNRRPGSERAIAAALGWHIRVIVERSWDVDCEYNRYGAADRSAVKRRRVDSSGGAPEDPPRPPTVTPDLIVHRRGLHGTTNNLLVLELKTTEREARSPADRTSRGSLTSILNIQKQFNYQHAVLLNLRLSPRGPAPQWTWVELAERQKTGHQPQEVYEAASLIALRRRGRSEEKRRYPGT